MRSSIRRRWLAGAATFALATSLTSVTVAPASADEPLTVQENGPAALRSDARRPANFRVLVFHKTDGVRRPSITDGVQTIRQLAQNNGFQVTATQDAGAFTPA